MIGHCCVSCLCDLVHACIVVWPLCWWAGNEDVSIFTLLAAIISIYLYNLIACISRRTSLSIIIILACACLVLSWKFSNNCSIIKILCGHACMIDCADSLLILWSMDGGRQGQHIPVVTQLMAATIHGPSMNVHDVSHHVVVVLRHHPSKHLLEWMNHVYNIIIYVQILLYHSCSFVWVALVTRNSLPTLLLSTHYNKQIDRLWLVTDRKTDYDSWLIGSNQSSWLNWFQSVKSQNNLSLCCSEWKTAVVN